LNNDDISTAADMELTARRDFEHGQWLDKDLVGGGHSSLTSRHSLLFHHSSGEVEESTKILKFERVAPPRPFRTEVRMVTATATSYQRLLQGQWVPHTREQLLITFFLCLVTLMLILPKM